MPSVDERLRHVVLKVNRAKEHIAELERETQRFLDTKPYRVAAKHDPQTRKQVYYLGSVELTPDCLPLIAGDAVQCLMSALDHLAYQIVCSETGDNPPNPNWIYFPIADDAAKYEATKRGKMKGARQETFDAIDALKPYKGGNDLLWMLYGLNCIEKHRLLFTVGAQAHGIHLGQMTAHAVKDIAADFVSMFEEMNVFLMPADKGFPLKEGDELPIIEATDEEPNPKQQFRFQISLNEPGIAEGKPLLETIHQCANLVEDIVSALTPRLR